MHTKYLLDIQSTYHCISGQNMHSIYALCMSSTYVVYLPNFFMKFIYKNLITKINTKRVD